MQSTKEILEKIRVLESNGEHEKAKQLKESLKSINS